ncbi:MAG: BMC domain-containing protein [Rhodothermales bacterium]|nr:BMC domain-containing protein [Rhodothermales bacterium]MDG2016651.1 BMC domain-containing protein [Rhodothermales bacterium]HAY37740.1 hypothetical protein [Bacteroidota bacterium]
MSESANEALGLIETRGLVAAIEAADAAVKSASVRIIGMEQTQAALITIKLAGETAAVQAAVDAGSNAAERVGEVLSRHVIARPADSLGSMLTASEPSTTASLENMTVRELRAFARTQSGLPIQGREIARANKQQLLAALRKRA